MVGYYPHKLKYDLATGGEPAHQDDNGHWVPAVPGEIKSIEIPCRIEYAKPGSFIPSNDGGKLYFDFIAYMPAGCPFVDYGRDITVITEDGEVKNTVKRFRRGLMNVRLWA